MVQNTNNSSYHTTISRLFVILLTAVLVPVAGIVAYAVYWKVVPAYSASTKIADLDANLKLNFYYTRNHQGGRYLNIDAPTGSIKIAMTAFDWAHNSRTSIYVTPEREIAVLGPVGDDHLVSLNPPAAKVGVGQSKGWSYIGAFDFQLLDGGGRLLRFVSASEQAECIPMRQAGPFEDYGARKAARQRNCSHFYVSPAAK